MSTVRGASPLEPCAANDPPYATPHDTRAERGCISRVETQAPALRALVGANAGAIGGPMRLIETKETS
jgi:hypothetical protein